MQTVTALNEILARDGYELAEECELSGHPIFGFRPIVRGVEGRPKNLIFASRGPKPEIGFADAINNDIVILSNEESCLVYDRPIGSNGLLWSELVAWWNDISQRAMLQTLEHDFKSLWPQMLSESSLPLILRPIETSLARRCPRSFHRSTFIMTLLS